MPGKVSWAFKMVSQFGSLGYTIMGKTADLTVVQDNHWHPHKEGKPQTFIAKEAVYKHVNRKLSGRKSVEEKDAQPTERTAALWGLSSKIDSRIWVNFTRNGLRLGSRHQESPHTDVSRNLATVVVRGVLPEPHRESMEYVNSKIRIKRPKNTDELKATVKETWASNTSAVPQTDHLHATPNWGSN